MKRWTVFPLALLVSIVGHAFLILYQTNGGYIVGPNDGLSQMAPFKHFLYESYQAGHFTYAKDFGFGGGLITQLAYYFSTSIVYWLTVLPVWGLDALGVVTPSLETWLHLTLLVSIVRLAVVIWLATLAYELFHVKRGHAFVGAIVYGMSVMYIRHVAYWEFFADAFLWVPLLVISLERIIRRGHADLFIVVSTLMLINNFYFAYINLVFVLVYVLFRQWVTFPEDTTSTARRWMLYIGSGALSLLMSSFAFVPAVYGFLQNERPSFEQTIDWIQFDNILYDSRLLILPALGVFFLWYRPLYRHLTFRLFASMSVLFLVLHFSPHVGSFFNGFSAPQYRWEYLASFVLGGAIATGLSAWSLEQRAFLQAAVGTIAIYLVFWFVDSPSPVFALLFGLMLVTLALLWKTPRLVPPLLVASCLCVFLGYTKWELHDQSIQRTNTSFVTSKSYAHPSQQELVDAVNDVAMPLERLDWMVPLRNNTPIVQSFSGTSLYSSILNGQLLTLYWSDLQIDMGRESVSRYGTLGNRANLHHLLATPFWMRAQEKANEHPYGFQPLTQNDSYVVYESETRLPFVRTTTTTYAKQSLKNSSPLTREQAMLSGVILDEGEATPTPATPLSYTTETIDATFEGETLRVTDATGGLDFIPTLPANATGDVYVSFDLTRDDGAGFALRLGDQRTTRKPKASIYRTDVNTLTLRTPLSERLSLRLPEGTYTMSPPRLEWEDYTTLDEALERVDTQPVIPVTWDGAYISFTVEEAEDASYAVLPVPYERGWSARVNGARRDVLEANYAFSAVALDEGRNDVTFVYRPPFFGLTTALSSLGLLLFIAALVQTKRRKQTADV